MISFIFGCLLTFHLAWALDLDTARSQGLVKELPTGYVEVVDQSAKALVNEVNEKRKAHYAEIAKSSGVPLDQVGQQAAQKIQEKLKAK